MNTVVPLKTLLTFDDFWKAYPYPRRIKKLLAKAKWDAITSENGLSTRTFDKDADRYVAIELKATPAELVAGVKRYDEANRATGIGDYGYKDDGKYICHPATWLNQGRWMDD